MSADTSVCPDLASDGQARRQVDRVAEHVLAVVDDRAVMEARRGSPAARRGWCVISGDLRLDGDRRVGRVRGVREDRHRLVADRLDDPPAVLLADLADHVERLRDRRERFGVTQCLVQLGTAGDVGEQDRGLSRCGGGIHAGRRRSVERESIGDQGAAARPGAPSCAPTGPRQSRTFARFRCTPGPLPARARRSILAGRGAGSRPRRRGRGST